MSLTQGIRYTASAPSDRKKWDDLCLRSGNLHQSTFFDPVQTFFNQQAVYLEVWKDEKLCGGTKIYRYLPRRLSGISGWFGKYLLQAGEAIVDVPAVQADLVLDSLKTAFSSFLREEKAVYFMNYGYYDHPEYLLDPQGVTAAKRQVFGNSWIELDKEESCLWDKVHPHHQRKVVHAVNKGYKVEQSDDIQTFLHLLENTYSQQNRRGPNPGYVRWLYNQLSGSGWVRIYIARKENKPVSAALLTLFGPVASYAFGGSERNNDGASHLLHWELIREFRKLGYQQYYLGQVALETQADNKKFTEGISPFKRRFGTTESVNYNKTFIFKPYSYHVWKIAARLAGIR